MINISEMSSEQKINELKKCLNKANSGLNNPGSAEYAFLLNSKLGNRLETLNKFTNLLNNSIEFFSKGMHNLDFDIRSQYIKEYNDALTDALLSFPGYVNNLENTDIKRR